MIKQLEKQVREIQKELAEMQKKRVVLRLQPCRGDKEIREKEEMLDTLDRQIDSLKEKIGEIDKKRRAIMSSPSINSSYGPQGSSND
ncbi:MAG: hypothetical protein NTY64_07420 [Deltaproteobacteria bacterium]|nr:hypothetical protein [Deltaproteobacteria bacterium]